MKRKIKAINNLLIKQFGIPERSKRLPDEVDLLIATILSQNTNDKNSFKAYQNLKENFKSWDDLAKLPPSKIERYIKIAGLGKQKSRAIKNFLSSLKKEKGKVSLKYLKDKSDEMVIEELTRYNGVGVKTASCVLLFSMRRNVCPVDTHVHRISNRLGLVKTNSPDKTFVLLNEDMPDNVAHSFHTNLIRLGREVCKPAKPMCSDCPLIKVCEYENKNIHPAVKRKENSFMLLDNVN